MFFVMTLVTSRSSSLRRSRFWVARASAYRALVRVMKVSNSMKAYGRSVGECSCCGGCDCANSAERSDRYVNASLRGYERSQMQM